jgi:hypothetical protein
MLGMRRTMFIGPADLVPVVQAAATDAIGRVERRRTVQLLEAAGVAKDCAAWLRNVDEMTMAALENRGEATAAEMTKAVSLLRTQVLLSEGKRYESRPNITSRVLLVLATEGRLVRGRPLGSWVSSQYRWAPADKWLPKGLTRWEPAAAQVELVRRWLRAFGPGTFADIKWWTRWTAADVKRALAEIRPVEVDLDGTTGLVLQDDQEAVRSVKPGVALLPALDATPMGWAERDWYLGPHREALFDRNGNIGPTVWWDGHVVGGWGQRPDGEIAFRLLEDVGAEVSAAVAQAADALRQRLGGIRFTPRFRTPLERELVG